MSNSRRWWPFCKIKSVQGNNRGWSASTHTGKRLPSALPPASDRSAQKLYPDDGFALPCDRIQPFTVSHRSPGCFISALLLDSQSTLTLHADRQQELNNIYNLQGHVRMTHREMRMSADSPTYD